MKLYKAAPSFLKHVLTGRSILDRPCKIYYNLLDQFKKKKKNLKVSTIILCCLTSSEVHLPLDWATGSIYSDFTKQAT